MPQMKVHIKQEGDDDKQEIDSLARSLRDVLHKLFQSVLSLQDRWS